PCADEGARLLRRLVRVDLIAEQEQAVRPLLLGGLEPARERPEGGDAAAEVMLGALQRVRRALGIADPAGAEDEARAALVLPRMDRRTGPAARGRPGALPPPGG